MHFPLGASALTSTDTGSNTASEISPLRRVHKSVLAAVEARNYTGSMVKLRLNNTQSVSAKFYMTRRSRKRKFKTGVSRGEAWETGYATGYDQPLIKESSGGVACN